MKCLVVGIISVLALVSPAAVAHEPANPEVGFSLVWTEGNPIPPDSTLNASGYKWGVVQDSLVVCNGYVVEVICQPKSKVYEDTPYGRTSRDVFAAVRAARLLGQSAYEAAEVGAAVMRANADLVRSVDVFMDGSGLMVYYSNGERESFELGQMDKSANNPEDEVAFLQSFTDVGGALVIAFDGQCMQFIHPNRIDEMRDQVRRITEGGKTDGPISGPLVSSIRNPKPLVRVEEE